MFLKGYPYGEINAGGGEVEDRRKARNGKQSRQGRKVKVCDLYLKTRMRKICVNFKQITVLPGLSVQNGNVFTDTAYFITLKYILHSSSAFKKILFSTIAPSSVLVIFEKHQKENLKEEKLRKLKK